MDNNTVSFPCSLNTDSQDVMAKYSVFVCVCTCTYHKNKYLRVYIICFVCTFMYVCVYVCLCTWISVFAHSWPSRTMNNKLYFDVHWRWTWGISIVWLLSFWHGCQSASAVGWNQSCCPQRIFSHPFSVSLPPSPFCTALSCSFWSSLCSFPLPALAR